MPTAHRSYKLLIVIALPLVLVAVLTASLLAGAVSIFNPAMAEQAWIIAMELRLPRAIGAILAGASLACAGAMMQGIFRNPLAGPEVLGVSAGASLGAVVIVITGLASFWPMALPLSAIIGALVTALLIYQISRSSHGSNLLQIVLAGMAVSGLLNALISSILLFANQYQISSFIFWTMGGLQGRSWEQIIWPGIILLPTIGFALSRYRSLNLFSLGEEQAHASGLNIALEKQLILACAAVLTAMAIAISGPVGFIGLLVPHLLRLIFGPDHRRLLPLAALSGALLLLLADLLGRLIIAPLEIHVGIVTSLLGSPFFLYLVLRKPKRIKV
jgi:iron complex transport system permease protein